VSDHADPGRNSLRLYSKPGCHLCEIMIEELKPLVRGRIDIEVVDIESRPDWLRDYATRIPFIEFNAEMVCQYKLDVPAIQRILDEHTSSQL